MAFFGEAPGEHEDLEGAPFVGPAGRVLDHAFGRTGIMRRNAWISNLISCRPPSNDLDSAEGQMALECCRPGLEAEIDMLLKNGLKVLVPLGGKPLIRILAGEDGIEQGITKLRGSVFLWRKIPVVPTFHPSYILRGNFKEEGTWMQDFLKARDLSFSKYKPPKEDFNLSPSLGDLEALRDRTKGKFIGVDIETTGLNPDYAKIVVVGIGESSSKATVIPFFQQGGSSYWSASEEQAAWKILNEILQNGKVVIQNALFDVPVLEAHPYIQEIDVAFDTMVAHHCVHPELPHRLAYIVSVYGTTPYWKGEFLGRETSILEMDNFTLRRYNARDAVVLLQIKPGLEEDLQDSGTMDIFRNIAMRLVRPAIDMTRTGMPIDESALKTWSSGLKRQLIRLEEQLRKEAGVSRAFNFNSDQHLDLLFHGEVAQQFSDAFDTIKEYEQEGTRKKKGCARHKKAIELSEVALSTKALTLPSSYRPNKTETGLWSYDEAAMIFLYIACNNRTAVIHKFARRRPEHDQELQELERTKRIIVLFERKQALSKMVSTYTSFPLGLDGRMHPRFKISDTATGRLASGSAHEYKTKDDKVNAQNIPKNARKVFRAGKGKIILSSDWSNLELRILAEIAQDEPLLKVFAQGMNVHDRNTMDMFGIDKSHPLWSKRRDSAKRTRFGRNYGGGLQGIHRRLIKDSWHDALIEGSEPDFDLTFSEFAEAENRYRKEHPAQVRYEQDIQQELAKSSPPRLRNAFGRVRIFLGTSEEIVREALNFPIQSTAADIANTAFIALYWALRKGHFKAKIICQLHDAFILEVPEGEIPKVALLVKQTMEAPVKIGKRNVVLPVEVTVGPSWGEQEEYRFASSK